MRWEVTMSKQTTTEYLIQEIKNDSLVQAKSTQEWNEVFKKAKQMELEQITDAYSTYAFDEHGIRIHASQYYNETYGVKGRENKTVVDKDKVIKVEPKQGEWGDYI